MFEFSWLISLIENENIELTLVSIVMYFLSMFYMKGIGKM